VEPNPCQAKPPCPVAAPQHEHSTNNRHETEKENPGVLNLKRLAWVDLCEVEREADRACRDEQPADDRNSEWTLVHGVNVSKTCCVLLEDLPKELPVPRRVHNAAFSMRRIMHAPAMECVRSVTGHPKTAPAASVWRCAASVRPQGLDSDGCVSHRKRLCRIRLRRLHRQLIEFTKR